MRDSNAWLITLVVVAMAVSMAGAGHAQSSPTIEPSTPEGSKALERLVHAESAGRENAMSWTSDNPTLDEYYGHKAAQARDLIKRLEADQEISVGDFKRALNTNKAEQMGGSLVLIWTLSPVRERFCSSAENSAGPREGR